MLYIDSYPYALFYWHRKIFRLCGPSRWVEFRPIGIGHQEYVRELGIIDSLFMLILRLIRDKTIVMCFIGIFSITTRWIMNTCKQVCSHKSRIGLAYRL